MYRNTNIYFSSFFLALVAVFCIGVGETSAEVQFNTPSNQAAGSTNVSVGDKINIEWEVTQARNTQYYRLEWAYDSGSTTWNLVQDNITPSQLAVGTLTDIKYRIQDMIRFGANFPYDTIRFRLTEVNLSPDPNTQAISDQISVFLPPASVTSFGSGCGWSAAVRIPGFEPVIGQTTAVHVDRIQFSATSVIFMLGTQLYPSPTGALNLGAFGAPTCNLQVLPEYTEVVTASNGSAAWFFNVPSDNRYSGQRLYGQFLINDPSIIGQGVPAHTAGFYVTNPVEIFISRY